MLKKLNLRLKKTLHASEKESELVQQQRARILAIGSKDFSKGLDLH
jgi:hypothetical protein